MLYIEHTRSLFKLGKFYAISQAAREKDRGQKPDDDNCCCFWGLLTRMYLYLYLYL